jgi:hypothetical protein
MAKQEKCQFEQIVEKRRAEVESKAKDYFFNKKKRKCNSYKMSCYYWDSTTGRMSKRHRFFVELTDEEYIYLLTEQLLDRSPNTYNRLVFSRPDLAEKVCGIAELSIYDGYEIGENPYLIIFDELLEDAEAIDGPESVSDLIYTDGYCIPDYAISCQANGRLLSICELERRGAESVSELRKLEDIDADKMQRLLGTRNYTQMLYAMRSLCTTSSPFDAIKAWLDKEHLSYKESTGPQN